MITESQWYLSARLRTDRLDQARVTGSTLDADPRSPHRLRRLLRLVPFLGLAVVLAACGGGEDKGKPDQNPGPTDAQPAGPVNGGGQSDGQQSENRVAHPQVQPYIIKRGDTLIAVLRSLGFSDVGRFREYANWHNAQALANGRPDLVLPSPDDLTEGSLLILPVMSLTDLEAANATATAVPVPATPEATPAPVDMYAQNMSQFSDLAGKHMPTFTAWIESTQGKALLEAKALSVQEIALIWDGFVTNMNVANLMVLAESRGLKGPAFVDAIADLADGYTNFSGEIRSPQDWQQWLDKNGIIVIVDSVTNEPILYISR